MEGNDFTFILIHIASLPYLPTANELAFTIQIRLYHLLLSYFYPLYHSQSGLLIYGGLSFSYQ